MKPIRVQVMRRWVQGRSFSKKGQSLLELAIFASVIFLSLSVLVSFALSFHQNQYLAMHTFRRGMRLADQVRDTYLYSSISLIRDKAAPEISSLFGIPGRSSVELSSGGMRSNMVYSQMDGNDAEIPRLIYDINGKIYIFKTAALVAKTFDESDARTKAFKDYWSGSGLAWHWKRPDGNTFKLEDNTSWDIDNDGQDEFIIRHRLTYTLTDGSVVSESGLESRYELDRFGPREAGEPPADRYITFEEWKRQNVVSSAVRDLVMDSQEGQLDMTESDPAKQNGLLPNSVSEEFNKSWLLNRQRKGVFSTRTGIRHKEEITRFIRLNPNMAAGELDGIERQVRKNNSCCYKVSVVSGRGLQCPANPVPCSDEEKDEIIEEGGDKLLLIKTVFSTDKDKYRYTAR